MKPAVRFFIFVC